jgi:hypothetical protein
MPYFKHKLNAEDYELAIARVDRSRLNKYSYLGEEGQFKGALGEIVFERWLQRLNVNFTYVNNTMFDYEIHFKNGSVTADVKTKARNFELKPWFDGSIPDYVSAHQNYDFAVFVSLLIERDPLAPFPFSIAQIGGLADKDLLIEKGYPQTAGVDGFGPDGNKCKFDCRNIRFRDMIDPVSWLKRFGICPTCRAT